MTAPIAPTPTIAILAIATLWQESTHALQSSYTGGYPDFVVYEYFTIYDAAIGNALATIHIKHLPDRQSWSAFSPDGRYFVAGNPNKLAMYELP